MPTPSERPAFNTTARPTPDTTAHVAPCHTPAVTSLSVAFYTDQVTVTELAADRSMRGPDHEVLRYEGVVRIGPPILRGKGLCERDLSRRPGGRPCGDLGPEVRILRGDLEIERLQENAVALKCSQPHFNPVDFGIPDRDGREARQAKPPGLELAIQDARDIEVELRRAPCGGDVGGTYESCGVLGQVDSDQHYIARREAFGEGGQEDSGPRPRVSSPSGDPGTTSYAVAPEVIAELGDARSLGCPAGRCRPMFQVRVSIQDAGDRPLSGGEVCSNPLAQILELRTRRLAGPNGLGWLELARCQADWVVGGLCVRKFLRCRRTEHDCGTDLPT